MCGHVGIAGKLEHKDEALIKKLLVLDYFRGPDSTGLASIRKNGDVKIAKIASHPLDLFDTKRFGLALQGFQSIALIGHNRLATKGGVNNENAHPFQSGHIVGAHNGTLSRATWDKLEELAGEKTNVDSQAIFAAIAKVGIEEVIKVMKASEEGKTNLDAYALVWADMEEGTLNFLRNKERSFWYCYQDNFERVIYASEFEFLLAATQTGPAAGKVPLYRDQNGNRFFQTKEDWLYKFDFDHLKAGYKQIPEPKICELKGKEVVVPTTAPFHGGNQNGNTQGRAPSMGPNTTITGPHGMTTMGRTPSGSSTNGPSNVSNISSKLEQKKKESRDRLGISAMIELPGSKHHPLGGYMNEAQFNEYAKYGCTWCQGDVDFNEVGVTIYEAQGAIMCPECSGNSADSSRIYCNNQH